MIESNVLTNKNMRYLILHLFYLKDYAFNLDKKISQNSLHNNRRISQRHAKLN